jgi:hypothetical protein
MSMTMAEALAEGTRQARTMKYAHDTLRAMREVGDFWPWMTPDEMRTYRQGLCRDLAIYTIDTAIRLAERGIFSLLIGDTDDPDADPDHAWCEVALGEEAWWADPTNEAEIHRPGWFSRLTPQRVYRARLNEQRRLVFLDREDVR